MGGIVYAQQNYDVALIPKPLLPYATAVVRNCDESIEVKGLDNTIYRIKQATTIMNKNGDDHAQIVVWHNKGNVIKYIKGVVYDAGGKQIGKFTEKDFDDSNAAGGENLFADSRVKHYRPSMIIYPYTVAYEYEVRSKQSLNLNDWEPNPGAGVSVEKSSFTVTTKGDFILRYKEINCPQKAETGTNAQGQNTYKWELTNLKAIRPEPYSPDPENYQTMVKLSPAKFSYEGIPGEYNNWKDLGKWIYDKLLTGRDKLPEETIQKVKQLTAGIADPKQKAKAIYNYMQQKTRYVSVQVGLGGYQPFLAADVDRNSYGDCKALVNYTQALLKVAGISSWYCVVKSGSWKKSFDPDIATMGQGDHVILAIPFKNDTTWLECTSQIAPFGFLGDFTDDRLVLACTPEGGKLLHTPKYTSATNATIRKAVLDIDDKGNLRGNMNTSFTGTDYDTRYRFINSAYAEQVKNIKEIYPIPNFDVESLKLTRADDERAVSTEVIKLNSREFANTNSGKLYFKINLATRPGGVPKELRNRTTDVYINRGYVEEDEFTYTLPKGYKPDRTLSNTVLDKPFGKFTLTTKLDGDKLTYKRRLQINDGTYPKESYDELIEFMQAIADTDSETMVLAKAN
ncbi:hypothetical protein GCM10028827_17180 [Mucilaginibacter myungsuensis]